MKNIIFREKGGITNFALWMTIAILLAVAYFAIGGLIGSMQQGMPPGTK
jgi:hypothetical protein